MKYSINGKEINIPEIDINRNMVKLKVNKQEAIKIWLEDEGYLLNKEQEQLTQRAKENKVTATIHKAKTEKPRKTQKERTQKPNPQKELIINKIAELLNEIAENVTITNKTKLISFDYDSEKYEVNLIQKRKPKN